MDTFAKEKKMLIKKRCVYTLQLPFIFFNLIKYKNYHVFQ